MSKCRFAGVLKEIELDKSRMILKLVPDAEYSVSISGPTKDGKETFAVFHPVKASSGKVYNYKSTLSFEVIRPSFYSISLGTHFEMILNDGKIKKAKGIIRRTSGVDSKVWFFIEKITAKI